MKQPVRLPLQTREGLAVGSLSIQTLPRREQNHSIPVLERVQDESARAEVRLLEESNYTFAIDGLGARKIVALEPAELFSTNDGRATAGRLATKRSVGTVQVRVTFDDDSIGLASFEVRSLKLNYDNEYQSMLLRISTEGAELVQQTFAASSAAFDPNTYQPAETLYQRFAFLQSILDSRDFLEAIELIRYRPHSEHRPTAQEVDPARAMRPSARLIRELVGPGQRQPIAHPIAGMHSLPRRVHQTAHVESFDTLPNQFVRFALERWKLLAGQVSRILDNDDRVSNERGHREAQAVERALERMLRIPALAEAGPLTRLPQSNTVLGARAGYRDVYRAFLIGDVAATIDWEGRADVFHAGQRDIAALYEYWVFLELLRIVAGIPGFSFERKSLIVKDSNGLRLNLRRDGKTVLHGEGTRNGRKMLLELWFNRSFPGGKGSWTVNMRPDCSLQIKPADSPNSPTWIHFDAKYRINNIEEILDVEQEGSRPATAKSDDLRKMHAYRDAIHRTSGAYVLYPGTVEKKRFQQFHEVLPGLGAFPLRPSADGEADAASAKSLQQFISDVVDHAASQSTSRERARYWQGVSYDKADPPAELQFSTLLTKPPADTKVLFGFVRSSAHLEWIRRQSLYNLRADPTRRGSVDLTSPELSADFVVLYDKPGNTVWCWKTTQAFYLRSREQMLDSGYVNPTSSSYLCIDLGDPVDLPLDGVTARALGASDGSPAVHTWLDVFSSPPEPGALS